MKDYKIILDVPAKEPALRFGEYAEAFRDIIEHGDAQFAIGIFGGWGSGKTTLMRAIETVLNKDHVIPVWFSAWRYEKEQHLIVPMLDTVREALVEWGDSHAGFGKSAMEAATTVGKVIHSLLSGVSMKIGIPEAIEVSFEANKALAEAVNIAKTDREATVPRSFYHASFRALNETFARFLGKDATRQIVVFIDDLDRCLPEAALEVIESMKLFFDLPGFVFVVGLDNRVIEAAVDFKYGANNSGNSVPPITRYTIQGTEYIKKIFQVPFRLFPVSVNDLDQYLNSVYNEASLSQDQTEHLQAIVRPHLDYLVMQDGFNPREIRRYINAYTLIRKLKPWLFANVVLALQTIEFRSDWILVRQGLYGFRQIFIDALTAHLNGDPDVIQNLDRRFMQLPVEFLEYIGLNGPAHEMLHVGSIEEYIYAGEATRSSAHLGRLSDKVRHISGVRSLLRKPLDDGNPHPLAAEIEQKIAAINSIFSSEDTQDPYTSAAQRSINQIKLLLPEFIQDPKNKDKWVEKVDNLIEQAIQHLMAATV